MGQSHHTNPLMVVTQLETMHSIIHSNPVLSSVYVTSYWMSRIDRQCSCKTKWGYIMCTHYVHRNLNYHLLQPGMQCIVSGHCHITGSMETEREGLCIQWKYITHYTQWALYGSQTLATTQELTGWSRCGTSLVSHTPHTDPAHHKLSRRDGWMST